MSKGSRSSRSRSLSKGAKKFVKRAKSPFMSEREDTDTDDDDSPGPSHHGRSRSYGQDSFKRSKSLPRGGVSSVSDIPVDDSERDLAMRLELARRNSKNQHGHEYSVAAMEEPSEETIYEGKSPCRISGSLFAHP